MTLEECERRLRLVTESEASVHFGLAFAEDQTEAWLLVSCSSRVTIGFFVAEFLMLREQPGTSFAVCDAGGMFSFPIEVTRWCLI